MAFTFVPDRLWRELQPILLPEAPKPKGGGPRVPDRACLTGIVYVLRTGMPWRFVLQELGCGSVVTCWRRLQEWTQAGVWMHNNLERKWERIKKAGEVDPTIQMHDLHRTFITRLIRANVWLPTVQKLAGHKDIKTTLKFYNWVSMDDRREAVEKLRRGAAAV